MTYAAIDWTSPTEGTLFSRRAYEREQPPATVRQSHGNPTFVPWIGRGGNGGTGIVIIRYQI